MEKKYGWVNLTEYRWVNLAERYRLSSYRWSSYPYYLKPPGKRPSWLQVDKVFQELKIQHDNTSGRKKYFSHMDLRVKEVLDPKNKQKFEDEWLEIRKDWFLGNDTFKEKLLKIADQVLKGRKESSYSGESKRMHDNKAAEDLVQQAFEILDIAESDVISMKKSDLNKQVIAWLLKKETSVRNAWIADRLCMGHYTAVTNALHNIKKIKN